LQEHLGEFEARGIRVVAISVDPPGVTREHARKQGYTYTFLSDAQGEVVRRYDLLHPGGGPHGTDIARPGDFLIDPAGTVRWANLTEDYRIRPRPEEILRLFDELARPRSSTGSRAPSLSAPAESSIVRRLLPTFLQGS
jgi:peroxiredoxin